MILYLHPKGEEKMLDELAGEENLYLKSICTDEIENLNTFVMYSQGNFLNSSLCVFHLIPKAMSAQQKDDLIKAVNSFKCIYSARLILILPELEKDSELMSRIMSTDTRNLITGSQRAEILAECKICLSDTGKEFEDTAHLFAQEKINLAKEYIKPSIPLPEAPLKIALGGTLNRIGTTTQAIAVYRYLTWLGLSCCYVDATGRHMGFLSELYQKPIENGGLEIEEITMRRERQPDGEYNAYIFDFGVVGEKNIAEFLDGDVALLCCGTKAWELPSLADLLLISEGLRDAFMLFTFTGNSERENAVAMLAAITKKVFFAPPSPDIFSLKISTDFYSSMLLSRLQNKER